MSAHNQEGKTGREYRHVTGLETASGAMKSLVSDFEVKDCRRCFGERMNFIPSDVELIL